MMLSIDKNDNKQLCNSIEQSSFIKEIQPLLNLNNEQDGNVNKIHTGKNETNEPQPTPKERKKVFTVIPVQETCSLITTSRDLYVQTCSPISLQLRTAHVSTTQGFPGTYPVSITTSPHADVQQVKALPERPVSAVISKPYELLCTCDESSSQSTSVIGSQSVQKTVSVENKENITDFKMKSSKEITNSLMTLMPSFRDPCDLKYKRFGRTITCPYHSNYASDNCSHPLIAEAPQNRTVIGTETSSHNQYVSIATVPNGLRQSKLSWVSNSPNIQDQNSSAPMLNNHMPRGLTLPSLHHISLQHLKQLNSSYYHNYLQVHPEICHTTNSLNQLTINSARSIDLGCTDGRNLIIRGAATDPSQLSYKQECERGSSGSENISDLEEDIEGYERIKWKNKVEYILSCLGSCVGLTNIWHFPYLCNVYGGVFLFPYTIMIILIGVPLLLMEIAIGQYTRRGPANAIHNICPIFTGVGVSIGILSILSSWHQLVSMSWSVVYFIRSFTLSTWNDMNLPLDNLCSWDENDEVRLEGLGFNQSNYSSRGLCVNSTSGFNITTMEPLEDFNPVIMSSTSLSWRRAALKQFKWMQWEIMGYLAIIWVLLYFSLWKSIRSSAKVVYFTTTLPYFILMVCLWKALSLPGASVGLQAFFTPNWSLLLHYPMWIAAATHVLHNYRISTGVMMVLSSYKKFNTNVVSDAWIISLTSAFTSVVASVIVFCGLGNIADNRNINIYHLRAQGPELVFMMFPSAWSELSKGTLLWAVLFFLLIFLMECDTLMGSMEVLITSLKDSFGELIRDNIRIEALFILLICGIIFLTGIPCIVQGGEFYFWLRDQNSFGLWAVYLGLFQLIAVIVFYKSDKLAQNIREMTGKLPTLYFRFCWWFISPIIYLNIWIYSFINYRTLTARPNSKIFAPLTNNSILEIKDDSIYEDVYPMWTEVYGWILFLILLLPIPLFAIWIVYKAKGKSLLQKLRRATTSRIKKCENCAKTVYGSAKTHHCVRRYSLRSVKLIHFKSKEETDDAIANHTHTAVIFQPCDRKGPIEQCSARKAIPDFKTGDDLLDNQEPLLEEHSEFS